MKRFLGIDGGGTKTAFLLIDETGAILARHAEGPAYYLEVGVESLRALLERGIGVVLDRARLAPAELAYTFVGVPAHGEDSKLLAVLDELPSGVLPRGRWTCGNDVVCGWAGALAGRDGINVVAGTGSIAYGEHAGRSARAGGWGELFSDEGSGYWIAREALSAFARMSDGRLGKTLLYERIRQHFGLALDLDLCAIVNERGLAQRSALAGLAPVLTQAAAEGDRLARGVLEAAARELAALAFAVHDSLRGAPGDAGPSLPVSWSGSLFRVPELKDAFASAIGVRPGLHVEAPRLGPAAGAALQAARLAGNPLSAAAVAVLTVNEST